MWSQRYEASFEALPALERAITKRSLLEYDVSFTAKASTGCSKLRTCALFEVTLRISQKGWRWREGRERRSASSEGSSDIWTVFVAITVAAGGPHAQLVGPSAAPKEMEGPQLVRTTSAR